MLRSLTAFSKKDSLCTTTVCCSFIQDKIAVWSSANMDATGMGGIDADSGAGATDAEATIAVA